MLFVLTPAIYIKSLPYINNNQQVLYPIEISINHNGQFFVIYFDLPDIRDRWVERLEQTTGNYKIQNYYKLETINKYFEYKTLDGIRSGQIINKQKDAKSFEELTFQNHEYMTFIFKAIHKETQMDVDIKMICKVGMKQFDIEKQRDEIVMLK